MRENRFMGNAQNLRALIKEVLLVSVQVSRAHRFAKCKAGLVAASQRLSQLAGLWYKLLADRNK